MTDEQRNLVTAITVAWNISRIGTKNDDPEVQEAQATLTKLSELIQQQPKLAKALFDAFGMIR